MLNNNSKTKKHNKEKINTTRKIYDVEKLHKCPRSRITGMETYKINCGKNLLVGYNTIKASEETSMHKDDFVHVLLTELQNYNKPVIVKVYDEYNFHLPIELKILKNIIGYRNTPQLICDFSCNDNKNKYIAKIKRQMRFCGNGSHKLHFFVYKYIANGDLSDFLSKNQEINIIKSLILQMTCVIIQLVSIYKIYHGDINSGNIIVDTINERTVDYCIEDETFIIESHGIIPKIIDFGRSNFYKENISNDDVWFDIVLMLGVIYPYIQNEELKKKFLEISNKTELHLPSLKHYYLYIHNAL